MSLQPPKQLEKLRTALHAKAKASPDYRFYALYDKLYRWDVLVHAYERCKANKGAAGPALTKGSSSMTLPLLEPVKIKFLLCRALGFL